MRVCVDKPLAAHTRARTHGQVEGPQKPSSQHSSHHQQPPHQHPSNKPHGGHSHRLVTHTHTRGKQDKGHSKTKAVVAMACTVTMPWHKRATPVVMPPWLVHQVHAPPMQVATSTHTHSATHTSGRKEELGEGPQGVERHSGVSETVPLCHPPCPQVSTPPTVRPASPPPGPPSTTHPPPVSEWRHRRVRVWRHTRHTVWCNQHSQPPLSHSHKCPHQHTPTTNPPHAHTRTHGGWERRGWHTLAKKARRPGHGTVWCG